MVSVPVTGKCVQDMGRKDQWSCWDLWAILLAPLQIDQIALEKLNRKAISELFANNSPEKLSLKGCYLSIFRKEPTDCLDLSWKSGSQMIENVLKEQKKPLDPNTSRTISLKGYFLELALGYFSEQNPIYPWTRSCVFRVVLSTDCLYLFVTFVWRAENV